MTATDPLFNALAGISVTRARIDTLSRNISNASTDGYSRKVQEQQSNALGVVGVGPVQRQIDTALVTAVRSSAARTAKLDVQVPMLSNIETVLGDPESNASLGGAITRLQSAFQSLSAAPEKSALYTGVIDAADGVARSFQQIYAAAEAVKTDATNQIRDGLTDINSTLKQIADVTHKIVTEGRATNDTTDLEDERDRLVDKLSQYMNVNIFETTNGGMSIYTPSGLPLFDDDVNSLSLDASQNVQVNFNLGPPVSIKVTNGKLGGLLEMRDTTVPGIESQLDAMASSLTLEFYTPPVPPATTPTGLGIPLFNDNASTTYDPASTPTQTAGYASRIAVSSTIKATPTLMRDGASATPLDPADTTNIDAAVALFSRTNVAFDPATGLPATGSLIQVATDFVAGVGTTRQTAQNQLDYEKSLKQSLDDKRSSTSGVQIDDEVALLTVLQQAYAANAKVIQTAQQMMDDLFAIIR